MRIKMTISLLRINLSCNRADFQSANQIYGLSVHSGLVTDKSIKSLTFELGFEDIQSFSRFFKNCTNKSPKEFRETESAIQ